MFEMIGGGERAGSGADTIKKGWADNKWPAPEVKEHFGTNDDRVELTLRIGQSTSSPRKGTESEEIRVKTRGKTRVKNREMMRANPKVTISLSNILFTEQIPVHHIHSLSIPTINQLSLPLDNDKHAHSNQTHQPYTNENKQTHYYLLLKRRLQRKKNLQSHKHSHKPKYGINRNRYRKRLLKYVVTTIP